MILVILKETAFLNSNFGHNSWKSDNQCQSSQGYIFSILKELLNKKGEGGIFKEEKKKGRLCISKIIGGGGGILRWKYKLYTLILGSIEVVSLASLPRPEDTLPHISAQMINIGVIFEQFVRASGYTHVLNSPFICRAVLLFELVCQIVSVTHSITHSLASISIKDLEKCCTLNFFLFHLKSI